MSSSQWDKARQLLPLLIFLEESKDIIFDFDLTELESDEEKDNEGEASESVEMQDNEGEASQSGEVVDNVGEASQSGEIVDNVGEASQSGEMVDNEGEASESDTDKNSHESGENNDESANMEHEPIDGTMAAFISAETHRGMQVTITTKTYNFFKDSIHQPGRHMRTEYLGNELKLNELLETGRNLKVFAEGFEEENEGYVSICFLNFDGSCIVSVIDASGNQRFSQSYIMSLPEDSNFIIDKFISHKLLLSDPDEFLPNGTLTLQIDASLKPGYQPYFKMPKIKPNISLNFQRTSDGWELFLDSPLAKCLTEESVFFCEMLETPMSENNTKSISISIDEMMNFIHIGRLLMGHNPLVFDSIEQLFNMYLFADKYDMPSVGRTYVLFLNLYARFYGADEFWGKVDDYSEKEYLTELLKNQITWISESKIPPRIDTEDNFRNFYKQHNVKDLWLFVDADVPHSSSVHRKLLYYNLTKTVIRMPNLGIGDNEYDFYN